jgi:hypothetical protein
MTSTQTSLGIVLAFVAGAAAGGIAVYASSADNRRKFRDALASSRRMVDRVPRAIEEVKEIANDAIAEASGTARIAIHDAGDPARAVVAPRLNGPRIA